LLRQRGSMNSDAIAGLTDNARAYGKNTRIREKTYVQNGFFTYLAVLFL
jgi:hypothetical protein